MLPRNSSRNRPLPQVVPSDRYHFSSTACCVVPKSHPKPLKGAEVGLKSQGASGHAWEEDAASVYGCTGTLCANSEGTSCRAREEDAANVCGYTISL